jgi:hypothetical protein
LPSLQTEHEVLTGSSLKQFLWQHAMKQWSAEAHIKADALAWGARIEQDVGNLVTYALVGVPYNFAKATRTAYCAGRAFPQNLAVSTRLYRMCKARLERASLWGAALDELEGLEAELAKTTDVGYAGGKAATGNPQSALSRASGRFPAAAHAQADRRGRCSGWCSASLAT